MSFEKEGLTGDIWGLCPFEIDALQDWEYKFRDKYVKVGTIKKTVPVTDSSTPTEASDVIEPKITEDAPKHSPVESSHDKEVPSEEAAVAKEWYTREFTGCFGRLRFNGYGIAFNFFLVMVIDNKDWYETCGLVIQYILKFYGKIVYNL